jgi:NAD(P)-dependent dehydrogenase (short-subunit alcohol dehydrogenase family)
MVQNVIEPMKKAGGGAIVNMSSVSAHIAQINRWTYNASKGAVGTMTKWMALDLAKYNIRVNSVSPAWIWTREVDKAAQLDGGGREKWGPIWGQHHLLRRVGEPTMRSPLLGSISTRPCCSNCRRVTRMGVRLTSNLFSIKYSSTFLPTPTSTKNFNLPALMP